MPPKKDVTGSSKQTRRLITIEKKKEIIEKHERGVRIVDLATEFNMAASSIATILKNKGAIKAAVVATGVKTLSAQRNVLNEEMEKLLMIWINEKQLSGDTMTQEMICSRARSIYADLKRNSPGTSTETEEEEEFKASRGWFQKFKSRTGIHSVVRHGEAASSNQAEAEKFTREFQEFLINEDYKPEQIFNADETGLFWKRMPRRTFITKEEKHMPGHKPMKDRLTLLLCANASGDCKIKPLLVYHSETPRIFKKENVCKPSLSVYWKSNTKAWVTRTIFREWVMEVFAPSVKKYLREKNLPEKILLLLDNAPGHPPSLEEDLEEEFSFIKVKFLPPNTTPLLQPMDQQVIANFKKLYTKIMFQRCFDATSFTNLTLREFWKDHYHILHCIRVIAEAWEEVTVRTLNSAWKKLCPDCVKRGVETATEDAVVDKIVSLAKAMDLEVNEDDVEDLVENREDLNTEDLEELRKELEKEKCEKKECSSDEEKLSNRKETISTADIKTMFYHWEEFQTLASRWHPNKAEMDRLCSLVGDKCLNHFKRILKKREIQPTLEKFFSAPPTKKTKD